MGNHHSNHNVKKTDLHKEDSEKNSDNESDSFKSSASMCPSINTMLFNTPYLTVMFDRLAEESCSLDSTVQKHTVSRPIFERTFNGPLKLLGKLLFDYMCREQSGRHTTTRQDCTSSLAPPDVAMTSVNCEFFLRVATDVLTLASTQQQLSYYFSVFASSSKSSMSAEEVRQMVMSCFSVSLVSAYLPYEPTSADDKILDAFVASLLMGAASPVTRETGPPVVSLESFTAWCTRNCPNLFNGVHCFLVSKLSGGCGSTDDGWHKRMSQDGAAANDSAQSASSQSQPSPQAHPLAATTSVGTPMQEALLSSDSGSTLCLSLVWVLSCTLPPNYVIPAACGQTPSNLSKTMAAFVPNFLVSKLHQIAEHNAWSLLYNSDHHGLSTNRFETYVFSYKGPSVTLISFESYMYVVGNDGEWRESLHRWGGDDCFLLQILPRFGLIQSGSDLLYLNHHHRGAYKGIQIGKDARNLVLQIDDMTTVKYYGSELPLQHVEVWGCAGSEAKDQQTRQRQWENKEAEKLSNRKLKLESWEDNPDRQLLSWAGINTNHAQKT